MRIENKDAPILEGIAQFSVPARCFEASLQVAHRLDLHVSFYDTMMGFQWRHHRALDCTIENRKDLPSWPAKSDVHLLLPQVSPEANVPMMDRTLSFSPHASFRLCISASFLHALSIRCMPDLAGAAASGCVLCWKTVFCRSFFLERRVLVGAGEGRLGLFISRCTMC